MSCLNFGARGNFYRPAITLAKFSFCRNRLYEFIKGVRIYTADRRNSAKVSFVDRRGMAINRVKWVNQVFKILSSIASVKYSILSPFSFFNSLSLSMAQFAARGTRAFTEHCVLILVIAGVWFTRSSSQVNPLIVLRNVRDRVETISEGRNVGIIRNDSTWIITNCDRTSNNQCDHT